MADEPKNPQQIIDDATKAMGQSTSVDVQPPTPVTAPPLMQTTPVEPKVEPPPILPEQKKEIAAPPVAAPPIAVVPPIVDSGLPPLPATPQKPELIVIPPKGQSPEPPQTIVKPPKKKGGKGLLIGMLLFFILTLPVAMYYGTQKITEIRSRAAGRCEQKLPIIEVCKDIECIMYTSQTSCTSGTGTCCKWTIVPTPTFKPPIGTCTPGQTRSCTTGQNCPGRYDCVNGTWSTSCLDIADNCPPQSPFPTAGKVGEWGTCYTDAGCNTGLFCGMTNQCVRSTTWCPRCSTVHAPDADPCACTATCRDTHCTGASTVTNTPTRPAATSTRPPTGNWHCNGGTGVPPPIPVACTNGGTYNGKCIVYHCPQGCGGTACGESSPGVWWEYKSCATASLTGSECGQIDTVTDPGVYCIPQTGCDVKALVCNSTCSGGPTQPPQATNTPRPPNTPVPTNTPGPGATNTPRPTNTPVPTNTPGPGATNTPEPSSTPTIGNTSAPGTCDASCDTDSNCESGLSCYSVTGVKRCRKAACPDRSNCECPLANEPTPTTRYYQPGEPTATLTVERVIAEAPVTTATPMPTPKVPVSGIIDVKAIIITVGSILLLVLGLIL